MTSNHLPFSSLDELRKQSGSLVEAQPETILANGVKSTAFNLEKINSFIRRGAATGAILDTVSDRREAQSLIDYWIARVHAIPRRSQIKERRDEFEGAILEPFDSQAVDAAVSASTKILDSLDEEERTLARRIFLRLLRLPTIDADAQLMTVSRSSLHLLGEADAVDRIASKLADSNALTIRATDGGELTADRSPALSDTISVKHESLIRKWPWLGELLMERKDFREMAERWQRSSRSDDALLGRRLADQFRRFGGLNQLEQDFLARSTTITNRWLTLVFGSLAIALLSFVSIFAWDPIYRKFFVTRNRIDSTTQRLIEGSSTSGEKARNIKWLVEYTDSIKIPTVDLYDVELNDLKGPNVVNFATATLHRVKFQRARLGGSSFRKGKLFGVNFEGAELPNVGFDNAVLKNVSFKGANLNRVSFDGATFCGEIDFSESDLRLVSFQNVVFASSQLPKLTKTPWWLIEGLTFEERSGLQKIAPHERGTILPSLTKALEESQVVNRRFEGDKFAQANQLNERAWSLAIYGADKEGDTKGDMDGVNLARRSIEESEQQIKKGDKRDYANTLNEAYDTLGYLLLQRAAELPSEKAGKLIEEAAELLGKASKLDKEGGISFRYAVALIAGKKEKEKEGAFKLLELALDEKEYGPTHELLFLAKLLPEEAKLKIGELTNLSRKKRRPPRFVMKERDVIVCQDPQRTEGSPKKSAP